MNPEFEKFLREERKRVHQPDAWFAQRVLTRWKTEGATAPAIWDVMPSAARPILAIAVMLIIAFLSLEAFVPAAPSRGMVEASLDPEQSAVENVLYTDSEGPASQELLEQLIVLEEGR